MSCRLQKAALYAGMVTWFSLGPAIRSYSGTGPAPKLHRACPQLVGGVSAAIRRRFSAVYLYSALIETLLHHKTACI
jgi:hypothetical protein